MQAPPSQFQVTMGLFFIKNPRLGIKSNLSSLPKCKSRLSASMSDDSSFSVRGPLLWDLLPKSVNSAASFLIFKLELDKRVTMYPDHPPVNGSNQSNALNC